MSKQPEDHSSFSDEQHATPDRDLERPEARAASSRPLGGDEDPVETEADADPVTGADESNAHLDAARSGLDATAEKETELAEEEKMDAESLRAELAESRKRVVRLQAELENYRKRVQRTLQEERQYASLPLMRDLLGVVDNLQRAIDAAHESVGATQEGSASGGVLEGVKMVAGQLTDVLKKHHCEEIAAEGTQFDPNVHEAIAQFPSPEHEPGQVTQVTQTGYRLHNRVIRPAQVIVAAPEPGEQQE
ncbi:MAG: nucleotide exchange factor GrpE [Planctomycetota bacterium]